MGEAQKRKERKNERTRFHFLFSPKSKQPRQGRRAPDEEPPRAQQGREKLGPNVDRHEAVTTPPRVEREGVDRERIEVELVEPGDGVAPARDEREAPQVRETMRFASTCRATTRRRANR